jgi:C-8 sterol isomerase
MAHVFDPDRLAAMAASHAGGEVEPMLAAVEDALAGAYPRHVERGRPWLFNLTAGALLSIKVLHASLTEYVVLFGTPIGTRAYSGRYGCDIWDYVLAGQMSCFEGARPWVRAEHGPGEVATLARGASRGYAIGDDGLWGLEYGRGQLLSSLPLVLGHSLFSAADVRTVGATLGTYGAMTLRQLLRGKV